MSRLLLALIALCAFTTAYAQAPEPAQPVSTLAYQVEVIVFLNGAGLYSDEEGQQYGSISRAVTQSVDTLNSFIHTPTSEYNLGPHAYQLQRANAFEPIEHRSWKQPAITREDSPWVEVTGGKLFRIQGFFSETDTIPQVEGGVRIGSGRYLHADLDFVLNRPTIDEIDPNDPNPVGGTGLTADEMESFRLKESRRILLNELHYFDHPHYGVLVRVSRVK